MKGKVLIWPIFAAMMGYAGGWLTASGKISRVTQISQNEGHLEQGPEEPSSVAGEPSQSQHAIAPADLNQEAENLSTLQTTILEKNAQIAQLQLSLKNLNQTAAIAPEEDSPEYREKLASELLELTKTKEMIQQAFQNSAEAMNSQSPSENQANLQKYYSWDKMEKKFAKIYTDVFSAQELAELGDFYRSELGTTLLKKQADLMQKTTHMIQQINEEIAPKIEAELEAKTMKTPNVQPSK